MNKKNDKGYILVTCLLLLVVLTIIGLAAIGTSTFENTLSGNIREMEVNMNCGDGATEVCSGVIQRVVRELDGQGYGNILDDAGIVAELNGGTPFDQDDPEVTPAQSDMSYGNTVVDIDYMYKKPGDGAGLKMIAGYEGAGHGSAGSANYYYRCNSTCNGATGSESTVGTLYRYLDH